MTVKAWTAGAYMVPLDEYPAVETNETLSNALKIMKDSLHKKHYGGAWRGPRMILVLEHGTEPVGMLTLRSILKAACLKILAQDVFFKAEAFSWYYLNSMFEGGGIPVREVMRPLGVPSVDYDTTIYQAARAFVRYGVNHMPVMRGQKITGILTSRDLFYVYYELTRFVPEREAALGRPVDTSGIASGYAVL